MVETGGDVALCSAKRKKPEEVTPMKILIKDTTREEREEIIKNALSCGGGCENCTACWLGGGDPFKMYQDYIDGKREIREINAEYNARYSH